MGLNKKQISSVYAFVSSGFGTKFYYTNIFGRVFNVGEYGIITTMQALVANIAVLMTPLQIIICKTMAEGEQDKFHKMNSIINLLMIMNAIEFIVFIVASTHLLSYLHLTHIAEYMLFVVLVFTNNIYIVVSGVSQGKQDFLLLGIVGVVLYSTKMIAGVVLGLAGIGQASVIAGFAVAEIICICLILKKYERFYLNRWRCTDFLLTKKS